jgi:thiol-disulfide isomerase/thioredoxin
MKNKMLLFGALFVAGSSFAQTKEIHFEKSSFADIKAKAKKENKLIFIDAYTSWCGPCKWMAKNVFTNDTVADYFNAKFVNAKIDMEQGEGPEIGKLYDVRCYPNLLVIDGDGKLVHRGAGAKQTKELIEFAENSFNTEKRFSKYTSEYATKKSDATFLLNYMDALDKGCLPADDVLKDYFATQKEESLSNRQNWTAIREYINDYNSKEFDYLLKHVDTYKKLYTADSVDQKIKSVLIQSGYRSIFKKEGASEKDYNAFIADVKKLDYSKTDEVIFGISLAYYQETQAWENYAKLLVDQGDRFLKDAHEINNISWNLYEHSDNKNALLKAEFWMSKSLEELGEWYAYDTYAAVLFKLKKKKEAKAAAERAIEMAKKQGAKEDEYKDTSELLKKIDKL